MFQNITLLRAVAAAVFGIAGILAIFKNRKLAELRNRYSKKVGLPALNVRFLMALGYLAGFVFIALSIGILSGRVAVLPE